jgi:hypothetical protein
MLTLEQRKDIFWDERAPISRYTFPVSHFYTVSYRDLLEEKDVKLLPHSSVSFSKETMKNNIDVSKSSGMHVGISFNESPYPYYELLYLIDDGKPQAMLTNDFTTFRNHPSYKLEHAVLEFRQAYPLAKELLEITKKSEEKLSPFVKPRPLV